MSLRNVLPRAGMLGLMLLVEALALLLAAPMRESGFVAFEDPSSMANPFIFIGILLAFTLILLVLLKTGLRRLIRWIIVLSIFFTLLYTFEALRMHLVDGWEFGPLAVLLLAVLSTAVLFLYPEWYVIDLLGVFIAGGVASIFGISLDVVPVLVLLVLLAVYDAISVYRTKHMITLASGILAQKTPILFIIPRRADYSFRKESPGMEGGERGAFVMGMGDLIMPSILVVSANSVPSSVKLLGIALPALGALIGSIAGLGFLIFLVHTGKPQAGLPPINGGAIIGLLLASALSGSWTWLFGI